MESFLHQPVLFPDLTTSNTHFPGNQQLSSATRGNFGSLTPLVRLVRRPGATITWLLDEFTGAPPTAVEQDLQTLKTILRLKTENAITFEEWRDAAAKLDELEGNNAWKDEFESSEYNYPLVQSRLEQLEDARVSRDPERMLFLVRTSLSRHLGGMGNILLYKHSRIGTKRHIERYITSALDTLSTLLEITQSKLNAHIDTRDVLAQVLAARQSLGRSALLLSGGGTFGMNHVGVIKSLWENRLLPRIVSGASAGSIVCAVLCTRTDEEIPGVFDEFCYGDLDVFTKAGVDDGILRQASRLLTTGALFDISNLTRVMKNLLGDITFQEAYNRTRRILNICVSSASLFELPRLLNYVTSPNVVIWSAVAASCSVPVIFSPAGLLAKDVKTGQVKPWNPTPQRWIDGSVDNDLPMTRLAEMFNVNHFIVSQVNPHVVPFLKKEEDNIASEARQGHAAINTGPGWLNVLANLAKDEAMHRMHVLSELGIFSNLLTKTRSVLSQRYSGDITIFPEISYSQFPNVLSNPTTDFMIQATLHGERATWPKLSRIQNHCAIELALDDAVQQLRARIAFSPSQVNLRLNAMRAGFRGNSEKQNSNTGRSSQKDLHSSPGGDSKVRRSLSSSESDNSRPTFSPLGKKSPSLRTSSPRRKRSPAFRLSLNTADAGLGSETDPQTTMNSWTVNTTDDSDDEYSDSPVSEAMVLSLPTLWPSTRQLFPYASQPATPASKAGHSYFNASLSPLATTSSPNVIPMSRGAPALAPLSAIETPGNWQEQHADQGSRKRIHSGPTTPVPLDIDVSGTRGMLRRKKRSLSTGMRDLMPPALAR